VIINNFMAEFICGRKFQDFANWIWDINRKDDPSLFKDNDIIWCKTDYLKTLFLKIKDHTNRYTLISHNSDYPITKGLYQLKSLCIKKWFAQNVDYYNSELIPLPIGLENDSGPSKGSFTDYNVFGNIQDCKEKFDTVYCNFNLDNNSIRKEVLYILNKNGVVFWEERKKYSEYCESMAKYMFVASPRGNGIDCHRTWEALYFGCIPIVEKHFMYDRFYGLPIIQVDDWNIVNKEFLYNKKNKSISGEFESLTMSYWRKKILEANNE
jgi:hypothetical protein